MLAASYIQLGAPPRRDGLRHFRPSLPTAVVPDRHHVSTSAVHYGVTGRRAENHIDLPDVLFSHHALDTVPPPLLFGELKMGSIVVEAWSHRATYIFGVPLHRPLMFVVLMDWVTSSYGSGGHLSPFECRWGITLRYVSPHPIFVCGIGGPHRFI